MNGNAERLARSFSELVELQLVLEKASSFFDDAQTRASSATFQTQPADAGTASTPLEHPSSYNCRQLLNRLQGVLFCCNALMQALPAIGQAQAACPYPQL